MHGAIELYRECLAAGIKPIIGCEAYLKHQQTTDHLKDFVAEGDGDYKVKGLFHQLILAMNPEGYRNLCKLTSIAHLTEGRGQKQKKADTSTRSKSWMFLEELEQYNEGLIVTSGCMAGLIPQAIRAGDLEYAEEIAKRYQSIFGDRFYIEIQDHNASDGSELLNIELVALAQKLNIELVATADNHYTNPCDKQAHDALLCINTGKLLTDEKRMRYEGAYWLPTGSEVVERLSKYLPREVAVRAVENTVRIAERIEDYQLKGTPTPPKFVLPQDYDNADDYLEDLAYEGLRKRFYGVPPKNFVDRLQHELDLFKSKNLSEYFLVVSDICRFCRERGILTGPGRGSAAGSLLAYALEITKIDPIHFKLVLERFLNPERMSYPDIDLDIDKERRHEIIEYLQQKYGMTQVAQIATFNRMVSKMALKDSGRVFGDFYDYANSVTKKIPVVRGNPALLSEMVKEESIYPEFYKAYHSQKEVKDKTKTITINFKDWVDLAIALEGTVKAVGVHAAGVVIGWKPLDEIVPLMRNKEGATVTQYSMEDLEFLGLLKMDMLGLKTLSVIDRTVKAVKLLKGINIDLESINLNDLAVLQNMVKDDNAGIFQFEADGAVRLLRQIKPTSIDDVSAITSLNRPGCLDLGMHTDFARRKAGLDKVSYLIPELEPILGFTYGLCVFQEQMLNICHKIAGFSLGKSDTARKSCGKKRPEVIKPLESDFISGCTDKWIDEHVAAQLWEIVLASAGYTFNASHAYCYSVITLFTAWLKYYYRCEFMAALCSMEENKKEKKKYEEEEDSSRLVDYLVKCKSYKIKLLPPDINESTRDFVALDDSTIRWGLRAIKGLGDAALDRIILERQMGLFTDLFDFYSRTRINSNVLAALIKAGALDSLHHNRAEMLAVVETLTEEWSKKINAKNKSVLGWEMKAAQLNAIDINTLNADECKSHFKEIDKVQKNYMRAYEKVVAFPEMQKLEDFSLKQRLTYEKEVLGMYASGHPLDKYPARLGLETFENVQKNQTFKSIVQVNTAREANSKQGTMMHVEVEDKLGAVMALKLFNAQFKQYGYLFKPDAHVSITAKASEWNGKLDLILQVALKPTPPEGEQPVEAIVGAWEDNEF
jgi:DNA polymerase-3 subunit alpha